MLAGGSSTNPFRLLFDEHANRQAPHERRRPLMVRLRDTVPHLCQRHTLGLAETCRMFMRRSAQTAADASPSAMVAMSRLSLRIHRRMTGQIVEIPNTQTRCGPNGALAEGSCGARSPSNGSSARAVRFARGNTPLIQSPSHRNRLRQNGAPAARRRGRAQTKPWLENWKVIGPVLEQERWDRVKALTDAVRDALRLFDLWQPDWPSDESEELLLHQRVFAPARRRA